MVKSGGATGWVGGPRLAIVLSDPGVSRPSCLVAFMRWAVLVEWQCCIAHCHNTLSASAAERADINKGHEWRNGEVFLLQPPFHSYAATRPLRQQDEVPSTVATLTCECKCAGRVWTAGGEGDGHRGRVIASEGTCVSWSQFVSMCAVCVLLCISVCFARPGKRATGVCWVGEVKHV